MGRKRGLTLDDVTDSAVAVATESGWDEVTLSAVAKRLDIRVPSLYNHVDGLDGLRRLVTFRAADLLTERFETVNEGYEGDEGGAIGSDAATAHPSSRLRAMAGAYRAFALDQPGLYRSLLPAPNPEDDPELAAALARPVSVVGAVLVELGVAPADVVDRVRVIRAYLHGFAHLEVNGGFGLPDDIDHSFEAGLDQILAGLT